MIQKYWVWWFTFVISVAVRLREEDRCMFKASLLYKGSPKLDRATQSLQTNVTEEERVYKSSNSLQLAQPKSSLRKEQNTEIVRTRGN